MGCRSQIDINNGSKSIQKSCQNIVDCYIDSMDRLASGQCDPENPSDSNCIYCCEEEYCNYDAHFESSFYLVLKLANIKRSKLVLKSLSLGAEPPGLSRATVKEMYNKYLENKDHIDHQIKKGGSRSVRALLD